MYKMLTKLRPILMGPLMPALDAAQQRGFEFIHALAARFDLEISGAGFIQGLRDSHAKAIADSQKIAAEYREANRKLDADLTRISNVVDAVGRILEVAGVPECSTDGTKRGLLERLEIALTPVIERDFAWALDQIHAGKKVTHPLLSKTTGGGEIITGYIVQVGTMSQDGNETPVYSIKEGYGVYERVFPSESTWRDIVARARKTYGWEIYQDPSRPPSA